MRASINFFATSPASSFDSPHSVDATIAPDRAGVDNCSLQGMTSLGGVAAAVLKSHTTVFNVSAHQDEGPLQGELGQALRITWSQLTHV